MARTYTIARLTERLDSRSSAQISIARNDGRHCVAKVWRDGSNEVVSGDRWLLRELAKSSRANCSVHRDVAESGETLTVEG